MYQRIRDLREDQDLSQKDIAAEMERGAILKRTNKEIIQDSIRNSGLI